MWEERTLLWREVACRIARPIVGGHTDLYEATRMGIRWKLPKPPHGTNDSQSVFRSLFYGKNVVCFGQSIFCAALWEDSYPIGRLVDNKVFKIWEPAQRVWEVLRGLKVTWAAQSTVYTYMYIFFFFFFFGRSELASLTLIFNSCIRRCNSFKNYAHVFIGLRTTPWPPNRPIILKVTIMVRVN